VLNGPDSIRADPRARCFEIGEMLFAQFTCPPQAESLGLWSQTDYFLHVLSAHASWKLATETWVVDAGETVFFRKGAVVLPPHFEQGEDLCIIIVFVPDTFVRAVVRELAPMLPPGTDASEWHEPARRVTTDVALAAFFHSMGAYFASAEMPLEALLRLKVRELLTGILLGRSNPALAAYFRRVAASDAPSIREIMETNFRHNLSLEAFAKMCHRSLSTFKREFRREYGTSPGRWLRERRLDCAADLLRTTGMSVTEIVFECGFEELSHLSRSFKAKFGRSPSEYRESVALQV
jgi:AraC family transcriptional regulator, exoenzyme S synthesis regulatory protein ExsA